MGTLLSQKLEEVKAQGVSEKITGALASHIESADDIKLYKMSPYLLADEWGFSKDEVLDAFLFGTRVGLFDLEWDIRCPSCKGSTSLAEHLSTLKKSSHCPYCDINITGDFGDSVEVTFRVNPNIRVLRPVGPFELNQSRMVPEEIRSLRIEPQSAKSLRGFLRESTYHLSNSDFSVGTPLFVRPRGENGVSKAAPPKRVRIAYSGDGIRRDVGEYREGEFELVITNLSDNTAELNFARAKTLPWVSASVVANNQNFRDLFASELIAADETFAVKNTTFVFTDIKGSTAMYERLGDSRAYYLVKEHFKIMKRVIKAQRGAIVKTIGDAVMATFLTAVDGIKAVIGMQEAFKEFNMQDKRLDDIIIKVGVHHGPCIAVTSNDRLDYFGQTVNIAARVQGLADGNETMLSHSYYEVDEVKREVEKARWGTRLFKANLKGIDAAFDVVQISAPA